METAGIALDFWNGLARTKLDPILTAYDFNYIKTLTEYQELAPQSRN
jgi:hypothetical protein